jgi:hypothetical protein
VIEGWRKFLKGDVPEVCFAGVDFLGLKPDAVIATRDAQGDTSGGPIT